MTGLLSRRAEDKIVNGYNEQKMRNGGITLNFTPDEKNDFDLDFARELQDRNSTPGMSKAAETCREQPVRQILKATRAMSTRPTR
ncbi:hypothetical protein ACVXG7_28995 [Enterobacter hormaechei]